MAGERENRKKKNLAAHLALRYESHLTEEGKLRFLSQPYKSRVTSTTAVIDCKVEAIGNFQAAYIHWYRHIPTRAPERLLYVTSTAQINYDKDSYKDKYHSSKRGKNTCTLSVKDIREDDEGTYYCAYWHSVGNLVFGTGTKLIVSNKGNSKPENSEILQTKHKDQLLYVCLIENFYPEVIRVQWVDGADKEVTKNVVKGDVWKSTNDKYSVSTWLTLPVNMTNKNYFCKYDHEKITMYVTIAEIFCVPRHNT
uniref:Ig-like domain-containing protein n=1 Tax=Anser cygnoides TaxID=8845 RepID=A0A8B9DM84_ANSCY